MGTNEQGQQDEIKKSLPEYEYEDEKHIKNLKKTIERLKKDLDVIEENKEFNSFSSLHFHYLLMQSLNEIKGKVEKDRTKAKEEERRDKPSIYGNEYLMKIEEFSSFLDLIKIKIQNSINNSLGIGTGEEKQAQESQEREAEIKRKREEEKKEIIKEFKALMKKLNAQIKNKEIEMKKISEDENKLINNIITKLKKFESNILDGNKEKFDMEFIKLIFGSIIPAGLIVLMFVAAFSSALLIALPYVVTPMLISIAALAFISTYNNRKKSDQKKIVISRLDDLSTDIKEAQRKGEKFELPLKKQKEIVEEFSKLSRMYPGGPFNGKYDAEDLFKKIFDGKDTALHKEVIKLIENVKNVRLNDYKQGNERSVHTTSSSEILSNNPNPSNNEILLSSKKGSETPKSAITNKRRNTM